MTRMYYVEHCHNNEYNFKQRAEVGLFTSRELAEEAIIAVKDKPGFCKYPDDFRIIEVILDEIQWAEGFTVLDPDG